MLGGHEKCWDGSVSEFLKHDIRQKKPELKQVPALDFHFLSVSSRQGGTLEGWGRLFLQTAAGWGCFGAGGSYPVSGSMDRFPLSKVTS